MNVKYPHITVKLSGEDGNAFFILGKTAKALKRAGVSASEIKAYRNEAMSGDYDHLLLTTMNTVQTS